MAKLPARKFHSYKCVGANAAARSVKSLEMEAHEPDKQDEKV